MPVFAPVSWLLILRSSLERAERPLDRVPHGGGVDAVAVRALHQHPRAGEAVGQLERQRAPRPGRTPPPACRRCTRAAAGASPAAPRRWAPPARRSRRSRSAMRAVELLERLRLRQPPVLGLEHHPPAGRAAAGVDAPPPRRRSCRWPPSGRPRPRPRRPGAARSRRPRRPRASSKVRPLAVPRSRSASTSSSFSFSSAQRLQLLLELGHLAQQRAAASRAGARRPAFRTRMRARLEVGERIAPVGRGELLHQVLARARHRLLHQLAHAVLHRRGAAVAKQLLELRGSGRSPARTPLDRLLKYSATVRALVGELRVELAWRRSRTRSSRTPRWRRPARGRARGRRSRRRRAPSSPGRRRSARARARA